MSHDHATPSRWRTRILWAALGSAATALVLRWGRDDPPPSPTPTRVATSGPGAGEPRVATSGPGADEPRVDTTPTSDSADATGSTESFAGAGLGAGAAPRVGSTSEGPSDAGAISETDDGLDGLPEIPLPRMPGSRFMRRFRRPEGPGWLITLGLSVPAPGAQVEAFYRSALKEQGMQLLGASASPSAGSMGEGHRSTLKARSTHASAEITIHQRANRLLSVVRIYWRTKA